MAFNIKTEPLEIEERDSSNIVDLSSDEDDCVIENKNILPVRKPPERPGTPDTHCSICLDELTNKCYSESCWHKFCFECLKRWSTIESSCPLCKKGFKTIFHTFNDQGLHETYVVPVPDRPVSPRIFIRPFADAQNFVPSEINSRIFRMNLFLDIVRRNQRLMSTYNTFPNQDHNQNYNVHSIPSGQIISMATRSYDILPFNGRRVPPEAQAEERTRVYSNDLWAQPLPDLSGRYRDCSAAFYRANPAQTYRLHGFIMRDVNVIRVLALLENIPNMLDAEQITNLIMRAIIHHDINDPEMSDLLRPYLRIHVDHFCHELYNYANSPYDMIGYDRNVRYGTRIDMLQSFHSPVEFEPTPVPTAIPIPNAYAHSETIILDSDSDEIVETNTRQFGQEIIVLSSSSDDDSDVEILGTHFRPEVETFDMSSRDQPSTSTGIRDSLDRLNNRYDLRRRRLFSSPSETSGCPVHMSRLSYQSSSRRGGGSINYISSSTDDESTVVSSICNSAQAMHVKTGIMYGRRKRKVKKSKMKKKRNIEDPSSEFRFINRSQYSDSSSSSDDSDLQPQNHNTSVCVNIGSRI